MTTPAIPDRAEAELRGLRTLAVVALTAAVRARFPTLVRGVEERGAAFQEGLLPTLVADVRRWVEGG